MVVEYTDVHDGYAPTWKCLGCGTMFLDTTREAEDEQLWKRVARMPREQSRSAPR
jgi:hypothetical protein